MKKKVKKYIVVGTLMIVLGILSLFMYQSYAYFKVNYTGNIINANVGEFGITEFNSKRGAQEFTVPVTGYYSVELWGTGGRQSFATGIPGNGGYTSGTIYLVKNEKLYFYVSYTNELYNLMIPSNPSWLQPIDTNDYYGYSYGSGGGATDVRYFGGITPTTEQLKWFNNAGTRIMVAGGGGGTVGAVNNVIRAGHGGGLIGGTGTGELNSVLNNGKYAGGGGQSTGGVGTNSNVETIPGLFGRVQNNNVDGYGAGGGGYYGGASASGVAAGLVIAGGGGSSYISGYAGVNSVQQTGGTATQPIHTNNTLHYSGKYFIKGHMEAGINTGNGKAKITYVGPLIPQRTNTKLNNVRYIKQCQTSDSSSQTIRHWVEIQAIKDGVNVAKGKPVTGTVVENSTRPYSWIVDGDIDAEAWSYAGVAGGPQCVTVDLGALYNLDEVGLWLYWTDNRNYSGDILSVGSSNASGTTTLSTVLHNITGSLATSQGKRYTAWD